MPDDLDIDDFYSDEESEEENTPRALRDGNTELIQAARDGEIDRVRRLLAASVKIDAANHVGNTALTEAAYNRRTEIVRLLLEAGANKDAANHDGETALILAVCNDGQTEIVQLLLAAGANKDAVRFLFDSRGGR